MCISSCLLHVSVAVTEPPLQQRLFAPQNKGEETVARQVQHCYHQVPAMSKVYQHHSVCERKSYKLKQYIFYSQSTLKCGG
jgi:hypothetical protein